MGVGAIGQCLGGINTQHYTLNTQHYTVKTSHTLHDPWRAASGREGGESTRPSRSRQEKQKGSRPSCMGV